MFCRLVKLLQTFLCIYCLALMDSLIPGFSVRIFVHAYELVHIFLPSDLEEKRLR